MKNTNPQIRIHRAEPTEKIFFEGHHLIDLFFQLSDSGNWYHLHHSGGDKIHTKPHHLESTTTSFSFKHGGLEWLISDFRLWWEKEKQMWKAMGSWTAIRKKHKDGDGDGDGDGDADGDDETGTFQAQAGGHGTGGVSATASA